jgi:hypothetical protein
MKSIKIARYINNGDSSVGIATFAGWTVRGSNPSGGEIFSKRPDRPWGPPIFLFNEYRVSFAVVKRPALIIHPHLAPRLKKE